MRDNSETSAVKGVTATPVSSRVADMLLLLKDRAAAAAGAGIAEAQEEVCGYPIVLLWFLRSI